MRSFVNLQCQEKFHCFLFNLFDFYLWNHFWILGEYTLYSIQGYTQRMRLQRQLYEIIRSLYSCIQGSSIGQNWLIFLNLMQKPKIKIQIVIFLEFLVVFIVSSFVGNPVYNVYLYYIILKQYFKTTNCLFFLKIINLFQRLFCAAGLQFNPGKSFSRL